MSEKDIGRIREDEWFQRHEKELLEKARRQREERLAREAARAQAEELARLREQHWMRCPKCGHEMVEIDLEGIAVDRCTYCEGIYFDRGELEDLLLRRNVQRAGFFRKLLGLDR